MSKKDFHIVRYYLNDEVLFATELTQSQYIQYRPYRVERHPNELGTITYWYRMDLKPVE